MAMAGVYPAGFRLNRATRNQSKAISFAQAIMAEINNLPFYGDPGVGIADLVNWPAVNWTPRTKLPRNFELALTGENKGIKVNPLPMPPGGTIASPAVLIEITVSWKESRQGKEVIRTARLSMIRSANYYR